MLRSMLVCLVLASLLPGCGTSGPQTVQVRAQDAATTVRLRRGDQLAVVLAGNPTTGYTWEQSAGAPAILQLAGEPKFKPDSEAVGAGGLVTTTFRAVGTGKTTLTLIYHRTFEPGVAPEQTFSVEVEVS